MKSEHEAKLLPLLTDLSLIYGEDNIAEVIEKAISNMEKEDQIFNLLCENCKYYHIGFDEGHLAYSTCRHENKHPEGHSWGICDKEFCPILAGLEGIH